MNVATRRLAIGTRRRSARFFALTSTYALKANQLVADSFHQMMRLRICSAARVRTRKVLAPSRICSFSKQHHSRKTFSSDVGGPESYEAEATGFAEGIVRHGPGDAVIVLNVGGKHFMTLRSTVASNPVLADYVARAEANAELSSDGNAVFVDRDPQYFGYILTYLRNKNEGLSYSNKGSMLTTMKYVQLPHDKSQLSELYLEAKYFQIDELQDALCHHNTMVYVASIFGGGSNPFDTATQAFKNLRRGLVALAGLGSISFTGAMDLQLPWLGEKKETKKPKEPSVG